MSEFPIWNCDFFALTGPEAAPLESLTVGAKFGVKCHGDLAVKWDAQPPTMLSFAKPEDSYILAILKTVRQDPNDVQYEVTSYKAGEHVPEYIRFMQSGHGFETDKPKWKVQSVLDPKQQPQPFGSIGPFSLNLPLWFTVLVIAILVLIVALIYRTFRRFRQRRKLREELAKHKTAMPPLHQFYRDARQIRGRMHAVQRPDEIKTLTGDLDREFRLFILRQYAIPTFDWSDREILAELKRKHRKTFAVAGEALRRNLRELSKLRVRDNIEMADLEQLHRMSLDTVEKLESVGGRK